MPYYADTENKVFCVNVPLLYFLTLFPIQAGQLVQRGDGWSAPVAGGP